MWWKQHVQELPRLVRMTRQLLTVSWPGSSWSSSVSSVAHMTIQLLTVSVTSASPVRLFRKEWRVLLDTTTLIDVMWAKQATWAQLETDQEEWHTHTHTHRDMSHWHTLVIVTDTHQHIDRDVYTDMTSYLAQVYRLSINCCHDKTTLLSIVDWYNSQLITVLLINTRSLSIVIDKRSHYA
jgi:hypothetical protein